jgi:hypothetical protein
MAEEDLNMKISAIISATSLSHRYDILLISLFVSGIVLAVGLIAEAIRLGRKEREIERQRLPSFREILKRIP